MSHSDQTRTALIVGAAGAVGGEIARVLLARGWRVRGLVRDVEKARGRADGAATTWIQGDAMNAASVTAAAAGCAVIVHAANPPGYRNWAGTVLPMLESTIAAAKAVGARIVFPGNVYNFGPDASSVLTETSPQHPKTRKGALRAAMERRLAETAAAGRPVLILRAGDFFGARSNSWLSQGMIQAGRPVSMILNPASRGAGHAWAYLPDFAETLARLIERADALEDFAVFHFRGHWDDNGRRMAEAIQRVVGRPVPILPFPWPLVRLMAPFNETFREMLEMRYLWRNALRLDNAKLVGVLAAEPHTPLDEAIRASLIDADSLPKAGQTAPAPGLQGPSRTTSRA
jgi:nucleoside-diphosphate-sugar epimerase